MIILKVGFEQLSRSPYDICRPFAKYWNF